MTTTFAESTSPHAGEVDPPAQGTGWVYAGIGAGFAGIATVVASSLAGAVYDQRLAGDALGILDMMAGQVPQMLVMHTAAMVSALLLIVFAAGLRRRLTEATPAGSLIPQVAFSGLTLVSVALLMGSALDTEFIFAAQDPDLIIAIYAGLTHADYDRLSQIAPTIAQPGEYVDYGAPWDVSTRTIGRALGKSDEAEALIADIEAQFAAAREAHPEFQGATAVAAAPYEGIWVYAPEDPRGRFLSDLGFEMPEGLAAVTGDEFGADLSEEQASLIDVDVIIWITDAELGTDVGGPVYRTLDVHTEGREVFVDSYDNGLGTATSFVTPLSLEFLLDGIVPKLAAAVDGDPDTVVP